MNTIPTSDLVTDDTSPEHDEIGPLTVAHDHSGVRLRLLREFRASLDAARTARMAAADSSADFASAVHDYRKALRRARALVDLVAAQLPKDERKNIIEALRQSRRALSTARDHAVAPGVLAGLTLSDHERTTANTVLQEAKQSQPTVTESETLLREGATRAMAQADALEAALPVVDENALIAGLATTYRAARRARRRAKSSLSQFHRFRRRLKELSYQLEFIADMGGARLHTVRDAYTGVSAACGEVTDLLLAREFAATYGGPRTSENLQSLSNNIAAYIHEGAVAQRKASKDLFAKRRKKFIRKISRALRKDNAPTQAPPEGDDPGDSND
jgi:CHAD domain-containing protein